MATAHIERLPKAAPSRPARALLRRPTIAWPTLALAIGLLLAAAATIALALLGHLPLWGGAILMTLIAYTAFTPTHDASHTSVSAIPWLNGLVGRVMGLLLMAPFPGFRLAHKLHHRHTNDDGEDPDLYSGGGNALTRPLRWLTQDLHYYVVYIRHWPARPLAERVEMVLTLAAMVTLIATLTAAGYGLEVLLLWAIPARLAIAMLAFAFDYLPHRPHTVSGHDDRYKATSNFEEPWLTPFLLYQNFHLVHHLFPGVPFYRYAAVWKAREPELRDKGAWVRSVFDRSPPL